MNTLTHWSQIHDNSPYVVFPISDYISDVTGWNSDDAIFETLIKEVRPQTIVEVGTWKGASAIHMANLLKKHGLNDSRILCVDTWLGSLEFWTRRDDPERYLALNCKFGFPQVYNQFIANVIHSGAQDMIIPFPNTSAIAAQWFRLAEFQADLVYVDASHELSAVLYDIELWWENLRPGGVIFGDDYEAFSGVRDAVRIFCDVPDLRMDGTKDKIPFKIHGEKWVIRKP